MQRIFDITGCLFSPPASKDTEVQLRRNERLDYTCGDIEEHGRVTDKIGKYAKQEPRFITDKVDYSVTPSESQVGDYSSHVIRKGAISREWSIANSPASRHHFNQKWLSTIRIPQCILTLRS